MLAQKIAGWAKRVLSSTRGNGSSPTSSVTRSSRSGARRATWSRISAVWLPWPGNSTAGAWVSVTKLTPSTLGTSHATSVSSHAPTPHSGGEPVRDGGCPGRPGASRHRKSTALGGEGGVCTNVAGRAAPSLPYPAAVGRRNGALRDEPDALGLLDRLRAVPG